ncbi:hypothetical protein [Psychrobacter sp. WY6]|uniref:hypothetical protein n=1 Tax=Psychrobacter sp. WY6 TaxID=2708350 RepID=UPI00202305DF|nr:hypothetical protein [Psychrobacter sp. WY6]
MPLKSKTVCWQVSSNVLPNRVGRKKTQSSAVESAVAKNMADFTAILKLRLAFLGRWCSLVQQWQTWLHAMAVIHAMGT